MDGGFEALVSWGRRLPACLIRARHTGPPVESLPIRVPEENLSRLFLRVQASSLLASFTLVCVIRNP